MEERVARDKTNTRYRVTVSGTLLNNKAASIIANAILLDSQVSNSSPAPTETTLKWKMEKDWELMSELDKEELIDKKIVREL